jgi:hypothetical protein
MISVSDILYLPGTRDLMEGGIAYALHALPYQFQRVGGSTYDRLRRSAAGAAVELAFRRYLSEHGIPFEVKSALPFTEHGHYDVMLNGRRCEIQSFLISRSEQVSQIQRDPELLLNAPALVASDQHAAEGHSPRDLYLFAFLTGLVRTTQQDLQNMIQGRQPDYLVHVMPEAWNRPSKWSPLGKLVVKSESEETQIIEIGGQDEGRALGSLTLELPPRTRIEIPNRFFSLSYIHTTASCPARMGIYSPICKETYLIGAANWDNLWLYGMEIRLAGYVTREEFSRRASFIPIGSHLFQYQHTQVKNLAVPVSELRPLSELFEHVKISPSATATRKTSH